MWSWLLGSSSRSRTSTLLNGKRDFTLPNMQFLHQQLLRYAELPDLDIVEVIRVLSEFLIYSDQHRTDTPTSPQLENIEFHTTIQNAGAFFEYFCEKNILGLLVQLAESRPSVAVQIQLLQTLSILIQNISTKTSLYYLLSNNYINKLLECHGLQYDMNDDVRDWFVTLLKALSLRLNEETVQFFFNSECGSFPLYEQALRFGRCSETMVKVAVKTLMLNVLKVQDNRVREFILTYQDMSYFADVVEQANEIAFSIQGLLNVWSPTEMTVNDKLEETIDTYIDHCLYMQDILDINLPEFCYKFGDYVFSKHVKSLLASSILPNCRPPPQRISTRLALYLLTRVLGALEYAPLVNAIVFLLLSPDANELSEYSTIAGAGDRPSSDNNHHASGNEKVVMFHGHSKEGCTSPMCYLQTRYSQGEWPLEDVQALAVDKTTSCFRQSLLALIDSSNEMLSSTALLIVIAIVNCKCVDQCLLRKIDIVPARFHYQFLGLDAEYKKKSANPENEVHFCASLSTIKTRVMPCYPPNWLISRILRTITRNVDTRILSAQLCARLLLDLVVIHHEVDTNNTCIVSITSLVKENVDILKGILSVATHQVMQSMRGAMADIDLFIYVLEDEYMDFVHQVDVSTIFPMPLHLKSSSPCELLIPLLAPGLDLQTQKATLSFRNPTNEMEVCRKAMRLFLIIRMIRAMVDPTYVDDYLEKLVSLRHPHTATLSKARVGRHVTEHTNLVKLDGMVSLSCIPREQRFLSSPAKLMLVLNPEAFVLVEKAESTHNEDIACEANGFVRLFAPIHRTFAALDSKDGHLLHITILSADMVEGCRSYPKKEARENQSGVLRNWHISLLFENEEDCSQVKSHVDLCRVEVRAFKLMRIEETLTVHVQVTHSSDPLAITSPTDGENDKEGWQENEDEEIQV